ncbi:hypothetical protein A0256_00565 [Mucilaginibacter sp. PAMC 26640]|nr:hypothetical protein A0256_00565 [Mucilaginibacter sp. PAMC 26640]
MIKEWLEDYKPANQQEAKDALREIMQDIALAGLSRTGFFEKAAFYGGTALRIFTGLTTFRNLFAGKMHALLFRKWGTNVKGRDWYDMEWYIRKGIPLNLAHFVIRAKDSGDWDSDMIDEAKFRQLLKEKLIT